MNIQMPNQHRIEFQFVSAGGLSGHQCVHLNNGMQSKVLIVGGRTLLFDTAMDLLVAAWSDDCPVGQQIDNAITNAQAFIASVSATEAKIQRRQQDDSDV